MNENEKTQDETPGDGAGPAEKRAGDREVNPADNPGPRGNDDVDPDRLENDREDLDRAGAN